MSETEATPEPKSKKKLIIIVVLVLALAGGAFFFLKPSGEPKEKHPEPGEVLILEPVTVNLAGGGYLKVGVAMLMTIDAAGHGDPNTAKALDMTIAEFSQADLAEVTGKRQEMQDHLEEKIIKAYHHTVIEIYYTEYVAQ